MCSNGPALTKIDQVISDSLIGRMQDCKSWGHRFDTQHNYRNRFLASIETIWLEEPKCTVGKPKKVWHVYKRSVDLFIGFAIYFYFPFY